MLKTLLTSSTLAVAVVMSGCAATESLHTSSNPSQKESIGLYNHTWSRHRSMVSTSKLMVLLIKNQLSNLMPTPSVSLVLTAVTRFLVALKVVLNSYNLVQLHRLRWRASATTMRPFLVNMLML